jgi:uncharacterized membrane protein YfcA
MTWSFAPAILALGLGVVVGGLGGLFGVGGGILAIPIVGLMFGMDQQLAQGTALVMILPNALLGLWNYHRRNSIDLRMAALISGTAVISTYLAARIANDLSNGALRLAFAVFLAVMAVYLAFKVFKRQDSKAPRPRLAWPWSALVGIAGGLLSGLFGIGGATIAPPALTELFGLNQTAAQGLALALITPGAFAALIVYARAGAVNWSLGVPLAIGGVAAISLGVAAAHKLQERSVRLMFCGMLMATALVLSAHA